jgi:hypothetical protein
LLGEGKGGVCVGHIQRGDDGVWHRGDVNIQAGG